MALLLIFQFEVFKTLKQSFLRPVSYDRPNRSAGWRQHSPSSHPAHRSTPGWEGQHHQPGLGLRPPASEEEAKRCERGRPAGAAGSEISHQRPPAFDLSPPPWLLLTYSSSRLFKRTQLEMKCSASCDKKREKKVIVRALLTALFCLFFIPFCLPYFSRFLLF